MSKDGHRIIGVKPGSIASEVGVEPGDYLSAIDGHTILDLPDYMRRTSWEKLEIEIRKTDGEEWLLDIEKDAEEELGMVFGERIMDSEKSCENSCIFCFIDQLPCGMRSTLYYKDDDWRLSFTMGNYITLTNLSQQDIDRIIEECLSPLYVSVHSTQPVLRQRIIRNSKAGEIMQTLEKFHAAGIMTHCQLVLCLGWNDGVQLDNTIGDLLSLRPSVQSVAVVPVGLTSHRRGLEYITPFNSHSARLVIEQVEKWQCICRAKCDTAFVFAADEFYIAAGRELPSFEDYEDFPQLENGVGLITKLEQEFNEAIADLESINCIKGSISVATGISAYSFMMKLMLSASYKLGVEIKVYPIMNNFFGETVTVAGLITGRDIIEQLNGKELGAKLLIPSTMLRREGDKFLDDITLEDLRKALPVPVIPVAVDGKQLLEALL